MKTIGNLVLLTLCVILVWSSTSWAQFELQYQNRGNRHEGIKPKPVSGYDLELISVMADYEEPSSTLPETLKLQFFLEDQSTDLYLTVREIDYRYYYWMDQIQPSPSWTSGFGNIFEWPTHSVLKALDRNMNPYDLGVLARLGSPMPSRIEHVAPVILYHSKGPATIDGYLFTLKPNGNARISCSIYREQESEPLWTQTFRRKIAGRPFTVTWNTKGAKEGSYTFVVTGFFLDTNRPLNQTIHFYHRPRVQ